MRKNCAEVLRALQDRKPCRKADSVWTDGKHIYSYATCILAQRRDGTFCLNRTRYSVTTTIHQHAIAAWGPIRARLGIVGEVDDMPRGVSPDAILQAYERSAMLVD